VTPEWLVNDEQRAFIKPLWADVSRFLPTWVQSVSIRFDPNCDDLANISVRPEYRTASIRIGSAWFSEEAAERRVTLLHEVLHAYVEELAVVFRDLLGACEPKEPLRKWAEEQWRRAEEGAVCDLSRRLSEVVPHA
jgi:hypothetical protein